MAVQPPPRPSPDPRRVEGLPTKVWPLVPQVRLEIAFTVALLLGMSLAWILLRAPDPFWSWNVVPPAVGATGGALWGNRRRAPASSRQRVAPLADAVRVRPPGTRRKTLAGWVLGLLACIGLLVADPDIASPAVAAAVVAGAIGLAAQVQALRRAGRWEREADRQLLESRQGLVRRLWVDPRRRPGSLDDGLSAAGPRPADVSRG